MLESKPVHILYMEDDPGLARLFQKKLERASYIVDLARDGKEGLAMYAANSYDVVVVDLSMPGHNGMEVIRLMASHGELRPTIMLTGMGNEEIAVKAMKLGACDYVIKDVDGAYLELLPAVVEDCLHKQRLVKEKLWAEKALLESEGRYRNLVETIKELIWEVDVNGVYTYVSPRTHDMYGLKPEEVAGKTPFDLMTSGEAERAAVVFKKIVESQEPFSGLENSILHKDGRRRVMETSGAPFFATDGTLLGYRGTARDITERKEAEERINYLTFHDLLTGLYNRTFFEEEMKRLNTVRKYPVGIIMADVNKLKFVNDAFGHSAGDELL
ncbi:MAG: PAS domain S-box protein, partial [Desulfobulbaceae bacterium]|nr:PAS domain S-box protein [Desulfobulbaceae bacterium]